MSNICQTADKQLFALVEWAKRIPHFSELPLEDQVILLRAGGSQRRPRPAPTILKLPILLCSLERKRNIYAFLSQTFSNSRFGVLGFPWWGVERQQADVLGSVLRSSRTRARFHFVFDAALATDPRLIASPLGWNELLIASFSHRSINSKDGVLLASELQRDSANSAGVGAIFDRYGRRVESVEPGALLHAAERRLKRTPVWFVTGRTCRVQRSGPSLTGNLLFFPSACLH